MAQNGRAKQTFSAPIFPESSGSSDGTIITLM